MSEGAPDDGSAQEPSRAPVSEADRLAAWIFAGLIASAVPIVLLGIGRYRWFGGDEWFFLAGRKLSWSDVFRPHNQHWSTIPVLVFRALWSLVGLRSYVPYQACVLAAHLTVCVLLRVVMRRAGVAPWIATAAAASFILFGPGQDDITGAFQMGFSGAFALGLTQLILADHEGPVAARDWLALGAGALGLMSSGIGIPMVIVVGLAVLVTRGLRMALLQTIPLALMYLVWKQIEHPQLSPPSGRPPVSAMLGWLKQSQLGAFDGLGNFRIVSLALAALLVVGVVLAVSSEGIRRFVFRAAEPIALALGGLVFALATAYGRVWLGEDFARSSRYLYLSAGFLLPLLAVAADSVARRRRALTPGLVLLLLIAVPWNIGKFGENTRFLPQYGEHTEAVTRAAVTVPWANDVPRDIRPWEGTLVPRDVTLGFLLDARRAGKLRPAHQPLDPSLSNEMRVRLGIRQTSFRFKPADCRIVANDFDIRAPRGTVIGLFASVDVQTRRGAAATSPTVLFNRGDGDTLVTQLENMDLRITPRPGVPVNVLCFPPSQPRLDDVVP